MVQPVKIVHLIGSLECGGAEMMLYKLVSRMNRESFRNVVVSITPGGFLKPRIESKGIEVHELSQHQGWRSGLELTPLVSLLRDERPQILHAWMYHASLLGLVGGRIAGVPSILWNIRCSRVETEHYSKATSVLIRSVAWLSRFPDLVLYNSSEGRRAHEEIGYKSKDVLVIGNGFDEEEFKPSADSADSLRSQLGLPAGSSLVAHIARFDPMKDHAGLLEAVRAVIATDPTVHFVLVGAGVTLSNDFFRTRISELGIGEHVHLLGLRADIPLILRGADLLVLCSAFGEGFPNVVGEAMMSGVPCVVTDVGDAREIVGETGRVVPARSPAALADAIRSLLRMPREERQLLGRRGRDRILGRHSLARIVGEYERVFSALADHPRLSSEPSN